ncbi:pentatricopeptide repeat-containing protein [Pyrus ussuriensis x Pyrus communis]|uniref:Pentatricopeptide repeat-containing protein n=1 Tax=Pyrus ussuriensis x Pyrus communis TaxID=2448454 RepID=A0A5N5FK42_9ROSA|nr:pentatricopeptide repeat-containing protein [Pyrus ussuriensis x Pyrus communis]
MVKHSDVKPDDVAFLLILSACSDSGLESWKRPWKLLSAPNPAAPNVWGALLGVCRIHNKAQLGEVAAKNLTRNLIKEKGLKAMSGQRIVKAAVDAVAIKIDGSGGRE